MLLWWKSRETGTWVCLDLGSYLGLMKTGHQGKITSLNEIVSNGSKLKNLLLPSVWWFSLYLWIEMRYLFPMVIVGMGSMREWWGWLSGYATVCKCKASYLVVIDQITSNQGHSLPKGTKKKHIKMPTKTCDTLLSCC